MTWFPGHEVLTCFSERSGWRVAVCATACWPGCLGGRRRNRPASPAEAEITVRTVCVSAAVHNRKPSAMRWTIMTPIPRLVRTAPIHLPSTDMPASRLTRTPFTRHCVLLGATAGCGSATYAGGSLHALSGAHHRKTYKIQKTDNLPKAVSRAPDYQVIMRY